LIVGWFVWFTDWFICLIVGYFVWLTYWFICLIIGWFVVCLVGWLVDG